MSAVERAMRARTTAHDTPRPTSSRPTAYAEPSGPVDFPRLLRYAAILGVPVYRWQRGRGRIYRNGQEVDQ